MHVREFAQSVTELRKNRPAYPLLELPCLNAWRIVRIVRMLISAVAWQCRWLWCWCPGLHGRAWHLPWCRAGGRCASTPTPPGAGRWPGIALGAEPVAGAPAPPGASWWPAPARQLHQVRAGGRCASTSAPQGASWWRVRQHVSSTRCELVASASTPALPGASRWPARQLHQVRAGGQRQHASSTSHTATAKPGLWITFVL